MANLVFTAAPSGESVYALLRSRTDGQIWRDGEASGFEMFNDANYGEYAVICSEQGESGTFVVEIPSAIDVVTWLDVEFRIVGDDQPDPSDTVIGGFVGYWTGSTLETMAAPENFAQLEIDGEGRIQAAGVSEQTQESLDDIQSALLSLSNVLGGLTESDEEGLRFTQKALEQAAGGSDIDVETVAAAVWELAGKIDGVSPQNALARILAVCVGRTTGARTGTEVFYSPSGSTPRVTVTVDDRGNRQTVTTSPVNP